MKKRMMTLGLSLIMMLSVVSPTAFAVEPQEDAIDDPFILTITSGSYYDDENGNRVYEDIQTSTEGFDPAEYEDGIMPLNVTYKEKTKNPTFEGGNIGFSFTAKFECEAGYYVYCYDKSSRVTVNNYGWTGYGANGKIEPTYTGSQANDNSWVSITCTYKFKSKANQPKSYFTKITCTRSGVIS